MPNVVLLITGLDTQRWGMRGMRSRRMSYPVCTRALLGRALRRVGTGTICATWTLQ